jgi:S1-C subfamily serine protease
LIADGKVSGPGQPWLGLTTDETQGRLTVVRVTSGGPAEAAGIRAGDVIVGVKGEKAKTLIEFYRSVRAQGGAGTSIALDVMQGNDVRRINVRSVNRLDYLKLKTTF